MKHIPKRYFSAKNRSEALLNIRRCLATGMSVEQMAQEITENYRGATLDDQAAMGILLTSVYDFAERENEYTDEDDIARLCARMFWAILPLGMSPRRTISYELYKAYCPKDKGFPWLKQYSDKVFHWEGVEQYDKNPYLWMVINHNAKDYIFTLCKEADLYCYVDINMTVNLFVLENGYYEEIEIEEESANKKNPPYYRAEDNYFESPIYKVRVAKKILEYCLQRIGFPMVEIKMQVFFTCLTAKLTNKSDYIDGGVYADKWQGVDIQEYRDIKGYYFEYPDGNIFHLYNDELDAEMLSMLSSSLSATAMMFSELFHKNRLVEHSQSKLDKLAKQLEIFVKGK